MEGTPKEVAMVMSRHGMTYEQAVNFAAHNAGLPLEDECVWNGTKLRTPLHWELSEINKILFLRNQNLDGHMQEG